MLLIPIGVAVHVVLVTHALLPCYPCLVHSFVADTSFEGKKVIDFKKHVSQLVAADVEGCTLTHPSVLLSLRLESKKE